MNAAQAARAFEEGLVSARTISASDHAFSRYRENVLPEGIRERDEALVKQGWDAGYTAAMDAVRGILLKVEHQIADQNYRIKGDWHAAQLTEVTGENT